MENIRSQVFPDQSINDWKEKAEQSLKGKKVESLNSSTYENIVLKPLYFEGDEHPVSEYPGGSDFRRGKDPLGYITNEWWVAQKILYHSPKELKNKLHEAVGKGQTAISFEITEEIVEHISEVAGTLPSHYPFALNTEWLQVKLLENLANLYEGKTLTGYIANDPIALFAEGGFISEQFLQDWLEGITFSVNQFPNLRTILIDTTTYHNGGGNAVQELGIAAATGVTYLERLLENGMELSTILAKMIFQFSIGSNFFMELAKLRAARIIWDRITSLYGAKEHARGMHISAVTSSFTKTVFDPHVNLLRAGSEAFAACLGGIQYLHVEPFNELTGSNVFSERIARNIQLILKEEAHLQKVIDPAGGSWYIESLTNQLAEKAWAFFQRIEANGGILEVLKSNWLQQEIAAVYDQRIHDVQTRKQSIIGTNVYAKLDEPVPTIKQKSKQFRFSKRDSIINITAIVQHRLAEPFEELRFRAEQIKQKTGAGPSVGMICLGEFKQYKARLDFMKGFVAAGGAEAIESPPIFSVEDAVEFISGLKTPFISICGTNEQYEEWGHALIKRLKQEFPDRHFFLAGLPEKEKQSQWLAEGIKEFIHMKSNCYKTLSFILTEMEGTLSASPKA